MDTGEPVVVPVSGCTMDCKSAYHIVSGRTGIERSKDHCGKALRLKYTALPGWSTGCIQEARTLKSRIRVTYRGCESDADPRKVKVLLYQTELKDQRSKKPAKKNSSLEMWVGVLCTDQPTSQTLLFH